jgi:hypothetical protein
MVREAAIWRVELVRRDTKVQKYAIDAVWDSPGSGDVRDVPVIRFDEREAFCGWCSVKSVLVAIDADDTNVVILVKKSMRVPSSTVCAIDDPPRRCRGEPGRHLLQHHGQVIRAAVDWLGHGQPPGALAPSWKRAE